MEIVYSIFIGMISSKIASMIDGIVLQCRRDTPFYGGAATAPPPASIAAYCSRAAPSSDDAANTRCRPPRPLRRLLMAVRVTPPSPAVAASPL